MYGHDAEKPRPSLLYKVLLIIIINNSYITRKCDKLSATISHYKHTLMFFMPFPVLPIHPAYSSLVATQAAREKLAKHPLHVHTRNHPKQLLVAPHTIFILLFCTPIRDPPLYMCHTLDWTSQFGQQLAVERCIT